MPTGFRESFRSLFCCWNFLSKAEGKRTGSPDLDGKLNENYEPACGTTLPETRSAGSKTLKYASFEGELSTDEKGQPEDVAQYGSLGPAAERSVDSYSSVLKDVVQKTVLSQTDLDPLPVVPDEQVKRYGSEAEALSSVEPGPEPVGVQSSDFDVPATLEIEEVHQAVVTTDRAVSLDEVDDQRGEAYVALDQKSPEKKADILDAPLQKAPVAFDVCNTPMKIRSTFSKLQAGAPPRKQCCRDVESFGIEDCRHAFVARKELPSTAMKPRTQKSTAV